MYHEKLVNSIQSRHIMLVKTAAPSISLARIRNMARTSKGGNPLAAGLAGLGAGGAGALAYMARKAPHVNAVEGAGNALGHGIDDFFLNLYGKASDLGKYYNELVPNSSVTRAGKYIKDTVASGADKLVDSRANAAVSEVGNSFAKGIDDSLSSTYNYISGLFR
jgi:hypothetical protein